MRAPVGYQQHILVIDESPEILLVMREILCEEGYRVSLRPNPDRCVEEATSLAPDLIIIDFPWNAVENRWTLLEGLHHDDNTSAIPVILCTGSAREVSDHRVRLDEMGIPIVLKPFDIESLLMEINARLCKRHLSPGADGSG
ncbi:MAG: response regulator [Thermomicrobiales bacterium]